MCCDLCVELLVTPDVKEYRMEDEWYEMLCGGNCDVVWRVVVASVDTAYGPHLDDSILVPTHRGLCTATRGGA